ncbi:hypothetical protein HDU93_008665 [Gonapodya sp. JEL0774]|nr:hypothetical protein HDU93_008665 [Gonapodya sp. JEL0774]
MSQPRVIACATSASITGPLVAYIRRQSESSIAARGNFSIALSGGSLISLLSAGFKSPSAHGIEFGKWDVLFADERCVPHSDPESTYGMWRETLKSVGVTRVHAIDETLIGDPAAAAAAYTSAHLAPLFSSRLPSAGFPSIDLIILGIGPDGHTASLFPNHELLREGKAWTAYIKDSPKPPPGRITLTVPVIKAAAAVAVVGAGGSKQVVIEKALTSAPSFSAPLSLVRPTHGDFVWFLDDAAAAGLTHAGLTVESGEEASV